MTFDPQAAQPIRIRFDQDTDAYIVEQERIRLPNGQTDPNEIGGLLGLGESIWFERAICPRLNSREELTGFREAIYRALTLMFEENVQIRGIDLGPAVSNSVEVRATRTILEGLTI